jgi:hypothetical protein
VLLNIREMPKYNAQPIWKFRRVFDLVRWKGSAVRQETVRSWFEQQTILSPKGANRVPGDIIHGPT